MRGNREEKQALDRQTAYLTFLPPMDEGFHTGYHTAPGIVSDHNRRPREWLESLARYLQIFADTGVVVDMISQSAPKGCKFRRAPKTRC